MKKKIYDDEIEEIETFPTSPEWEINADLPAEKIVEGLDLLVRGYGIRKVSVHLGITVDKIKHL